MHRLILLVLLLTGAGLAGCASTQPPYTTGPIKTVDPDRQPMPEPEEAREDIEPLQEILEQRQESEEG